MSEQVSLNRRRLLSLIGSVPLARAAASAQQESMQLGGSMPPDLPRDLKPTGADTGSLFSDIERLAGHSQYSHSFLSNRFRSLEEYKKAGREIVLDALGYRPPTVAPKPELIDRQDLGEFVRERLLFSTTPDFRVPAYVHIPKNLKGKAPAIVDLHSHGGMYLFGKEKVIDFGRNHPVMTKYHERNYGGRPTTTALVRRGYVVITIDAFMFGERRLIMDDDLKYGWDRTKYSVEDVAHLNARCGRKESTLAKSLTFVGMTWSGIVSWDDMRTVDYLITRPEVDPKRIGCVGISMGGYRSLYLAGLDERIRAACVVGFMSTVKPMIRAHIDTHSWVHFVPKLHRYLDLPDVVAMMAPKPLLVLQCKRDGLFPPSGMQESVEKIAAVYTKAGVKKRFVGRFYDVPHIFDVRMQDDAFAWFDQHLKA
jgi:dienelactone hydrolase